MSGACKHDWHFVQGLTARLRCTRCGIMTWPKDAEQKVQEVLQDVHSCSYYCDRPECIKAQRDELRDRLAQPNEFNPDWDAMAVMVEEQQRMAKRIAELEAQPEQGPLQFKCTIVDDAHPNGVPLEQWGKQPEQEPVKESSITHGHLWIGDLYGKEKNT